ncbi:hypothetical protein ACIXHV_21075 [Bacteroides fragilis]|jgi:hypothetical protein|nr:MAG TPA: hypothetical protein [Caudoviricetes sp.]
MTRAEVQTRIDESAQAHFDSLVRAEVTLMLERLTVSEGETVTDLVVYDTDKPAADSTGLPPVKAVLHKEHRQKRQSRETAQADVQTQAQVTADTAEDSTRQSDSVQTSEQKPGAGTGILRLGAGMFSLAVSVLAIRIFYKRIKR